MRPNENQGGVEAAPSADLAMPHWGTEPFLQLDHSGVWNFQTRSQPIIRRSDRMM